MSLQVIYIFEIFYGGGLSLGAFPSCIIAILNGSGGLFALILIYMVGTLLIRLDTTLNFAKSIQREATVDKQ